MIQTSSVTGSRRLVFRRKNVWVWKNVPVLLGEVQNWKTLFSLGTLAQRLLRRYVELWSAAARITFYGLKKQALVQCSFCVSVFCHSSAATPNRPVFVYGCFPGTLIIVRRMPLRVVLWKKAVMREQKHWKCVLWLWRTLEYCNNKCSLWPFAQFAFRCISFDMHCKIPNSPSLQKYDLELLLGRSLIQLLINITTKGISILFIYEDMGTSLEKVSLWYKLMSV